MKNLVSAAGGIKLKTPDNADAKSIDKKEGILAYIYINCRTDAAVASGLYAFSLAVIIAGINYIRSGMLASIGQAFGAAFGICVFLGVNYLASRKLKAVSVKLERKYKKSADALRRTSAVISVCSICALAFMGIIITASLALLIAVAW